MTTLLLTCRVPDYSAWRPLYVESISHIPEVLAWRVWHGEDDPNFVVIEERYESRAFAENLLNSDEMQKEMAAHGVSSVQAYFLKEDGSGSR
ncbi:MAG TPA: hypothetical protein VHW04_14325 [Solirubrobacteraceae bacterium]|nr:hypothetical protein [Solirubrobacteraceae bacterium]